jgi:hypothetical protein
MEAILMKSGVFHLPGKKALLYLRAECFACDGGESPVEHPPKTAALLLR